MISFIVNQNDRLYTSTLMKWDSLVTIDTDNNKKSFLSTASNASNTYIKSIKYWVVRLKHSYIRENSKRFSDK